MKIMVLPSIFLALGMAVLPLFSLGKEKKPGAVVDSQSSVFACYLRNLEPVLAARGEKYQVYIGTKINETDATHATLLIGAGNVTTGKISLYAIELKTDEGSEWIYNRTTSGEIGIVSFEEVVQEITVGLGNTEFQMLTELVKLSVPDCFVKQM